MNPIDIHIEIKPTYGWLHPPKNIIEQIERDTYETRMNYHLNILVHKLEDKLNDVVGREDLQRKAQEEVQRLMYRRV